MKTCLAYPKPVLQTEIEIENLNWNLLNKRAEISAGIEISRNQNEIDEIN